MVRIPFISDRESYEDTLEHGGCDVGFVYGAPNDYESRIRFMGAQYDITHNWDFGNDVPDVLVVPEEEQEAVDSSEIENLEELGVDVQEPYRELDTTADDVDSALDVADGGDTVHGFTSDYHGWKCDLTARKAFGMYGDDNTYRTFAFDTYIGKREQPCKRNFFAQTADVFLRQRDAVENLDR